MNAQQVRSTTAGLKATAFTSLRLLGAACCLRCVPEISCTAGAQALSIGLEKDGVCKSALIGVLAIHLVQRERQLSQLLRSSAPDCLLTLQSSNSLTSRVSSLEHRALTPLFQMG